MDKRSQYLNNLPKVDENSEIQENSLNALNTFLPTNQFCLRDERIRDYGVDASLEILENESATNFRTQIQLKGTRSLKPIKDGSYSLQVKTKNLQYLLNAPLSMYILYIEPIKEFRFVWASTEFQRLAEENPKWIEQADVTLKFTEVLDLTKLGEIRERIINKGVFTRNLNETLFLSKSPNVVLEINPETLEITDSQKLKKLLLEQGELYCLKGYASQVLEKINLLALKDRKIPKIQIIKSIAELEQGFYQRAKETLARLEIDNAKLSTEEQLIIGFIKSNCNYQTGRIAHSEFVKELKRLSEIEHKPLIFELRMNYLKNAILGEKNIDSRRALVNEFKCEAEKTMNLEKLSVIGVRNKLLVWEAEADQIHLERLREIMPLIIINLLGVPVDITHSFSKYDERILPWENEINEILQNVQDEIIKADLICLKVKSYIRHLNTLTLLSELGLFVVKLEEQLFISMKNSISLAIETYQNEDLIEYKLRAEVILAQLLIHEQKDDIANNINLRVSNIADDMSYPHVKYLTDKPMLKSIKEIANRMKEI